jgi:hypothetical protein
MEIDSPIKSLFQPLPLVTPAKFQANSIQSSTAIEQAETMEIKLQSKKA